MPPISDLRSLTSDNKRTVVLLLSDKRSGSTMFQRELCKHPEIRTVDYSPHTYEETHHWLKAAVMLDVDPALFSGGRVYNGYGSKKNARTYMEDCIKGNVPEFTIPADDRELVFQGWEALCEKYTRPVFFEKSPQFLAHWGCLELILEWMQQTEFDVKVIGLVRNPLSVMYSALELFHTPPEKRQAGWVKIHENLLRFREQLAEVGGRRSEDGGQRTEDRGQRTEDPAALSELCRTSGGRTTDVGARTNLNPNHLTAKTVPASAAAHQFMTVRYEDLIHDPVSTFGKICRFIGVDECAEVGAGARSTSLNKWESDPFFTFQVDETTRAMARKLGYTDTELTNPDKPKPPASLRLKRKVEGAVKLSIARFRDRFVAPMRLRRRLRREDRSQRSEAASSS